MPRAVDPSEQFTVVLACDAELDLAQQPRFIYHYLTAREHRQLGRLNEKLLDAKTIDEVTDSTFAALAMGLVRWENVTDRDGNPVDFNVEKFEDIIGLIEAQELVNQIAMQNPGLVSPSDKKKQDSPSACASGKSATTADPGNA